MEKYACYIFDVDDTLLDYHDTEKNIMINIFSHEGKIIDEMVLSDLWELSCFWWDKYDLENSKDTYVQRNYHSLFGKYLDDFMKDIKNRYELRQSTQKLSEMFIQYLKEETIIFEDTEIVLRELSKRATLVIATNGFSVVQKYRLRNYSSLFSDFFVSEEAGVIKPSKLFWEYVFKHISFRPAECLMVGDSLVNDIESANDYGIDTCWINRRKKKNTSDVEPCYEIDSLKDLLD